MRRFKDEGLITDARYFTLTKEDIVPLERFGEKSAENIVKEIKIKRKFTFKISLALGILHVGGRSNRDLAEHFGTLEKVMNSHKIRPYG